MHLIIKYYVHIDLANSIFTIVSEYYNILSLLYTWRKHLQQSHNIVYLMLLLEVDGSVILERINVYYMFHINIANIVCSYLTLFFLASALVTLFYHLKYGFVRSTRQFN